MHKNNYKTWLCLGVESGIPWPISKTIIKHENYEFILRPETEILSPSIAFDFGSSGIDITEALLIVRRYLSALAWHEGTGIREIMYVTSSGPAEIGKSSRWSVQTHKFDYPSLQIASTPKQQLALAFYRESLNLNSIPYKFLSFSKIINIIADKGHDQKCWINSNIHRIKCPRSKKVISDLNFKKIDIGEYIYSSGRCATAHAFGSPVIDPDVSSDLERMTNELPLVKELAEIVIEYELGIKSRRTVLKEHEFEIQGFKDLFPEKLIKEIKDYKDRFISVEELDLILSLGIRSKPKYYGLDNLRIDKARMIQGILYLCLESEENALKFTLGIDFINNFLQYNPYEGPLVIDNGSAIASRCILGFYQFSRDLFLNGQLKIEDVATGKLLGFKTAFVPVDVDLKRTLQDIDATITALNEDINVRCLQNQKRKNSQEIP